MLKIRRAPVLLNPLLLADKRVSAWGWLQGDHPATACAIARETGLWTASSFVIEGKDLPKDEAVLGALLDRDGFVVSRVSPEEKLLIARALRGRGHVVAMTGDGVNDAPALHEADIGSRWGVLARMWPAKQPTWCFSMIISRRLWR